MGFKSCQMDHCIAGIRGSVAELNTNVVPNEYPNGFQGVREPTLRERIEYMDSWEEYVKSITSYQEYGNTKHNDLKIISELYRNGLNMKATAIAIGYYASIKHKNKGSYEALTNRLKRINTKNPALTIEPLIEKGWITKETIQNILITPDNPYPAELSKRRGKFFKFYAKWYVVGVLQVYGGNVQNTATHIGVDENVIIYWLEREVEQVLIKGGVKL